MRKVKFEDRRLGFANAVEGTFTLKGAKVRGSKDGSNAEGQAKEPFLYAICKSTQGRKSVLISAGDLQAAAEEAKYPKDRLPFPTLTLGGEVDEKQTPNENFAFAILNGNIVVPALKQA